MPRRVASNDLLRISKYGKSVINFLGEGEHLVRSTGYQIVELQEKVCRDRLALAFQILKSGHLAAKRRPAQCRTAVGRAYYAMYQAMRALLYYIEGGDDFEKHDALPRRIPGDFPDRANWQNYLKLARLERNRADYDPYPRRDLAFENSARICLTYADDLLPIVRRYLRGKGFTP